MHKRCKHIGCGKVLSFNFEGEQGGGRFCAQHHKEQGMVVNAACKRCRFCAQLKLEGTVAGSSAAGTFFFSPPTTQQNRCEHGGCEKRPFFKFDGEQKKGMFCGQHRPPGMVDVYLFSCGR
mmetsp:Transcript_3289/g.4778  ORF Transcript_3289/g.4778 Transcript_3289/m.4778 type:complete len:121 (+) Transcript_3289:169-531(+)